MMMTNLREGEIRGDLGMAGFCAEAKACCALTLCGATQKYRACFVLYESCTNAWKKELKNGHSLMHEKFIHQVVRRA